MSRAVALVWIVTGIVAVSWPGITIRALAIVVGVALIVGGAVKIWSALLGESDERFVLGLSGVTNVVVGVLALSLPGITILALAILFGVGTILFGFGQIALALRLRSAPPGAVVAQRRWPRWLRLIGTAAVLLLALAAAAISAAVDRAKPNAPGPFYTAPSPLPASPPGTIIRSELIGGFHAGATAYRVLYKSTGYDGKPTAVSGFIVVPDGTAPAQGRNVIAYTHGTVGVASNCAPSLAKGSDQILFFEGGAAFLGSPNGSVGSGDGRGVRVAGRRG